MGAALGIFLITVTLFSDKPPEHQQILTSDITECMNLQYQWLTEHKPLEDEVSFGAGCQAKTEKQS